MKASKFCRDLAKQYVNVAIAPSYVCLAIGNTCKDVHIAQMICDRIDEYLYPCHTMLGYLVTKEKLDANDITPAYLAERRVKMLLSIAKDFEAKGK